MALRRTIEENEMPDEAQFSSALGGSRRTIQSSPLAAIGVSGFAFRSLLEPSECDRLIRRALRHGFRSPSSAYPPSYRNNRRLAVDDEGLAAALWIRLKNAAPAVIVDDDGVRWEPHSINSRFRFCQYNKGEAFFIHQDGVFHRNECEKSFLTLLIYLNGAPDFAGGATRFFPDHDDSGRALLSIAPIPGDAVIFDHRIWHDGSEIFEGTKYVLRSDLIYKKSEPRPPRSGDPAVGEHRGYVWDLVVAQNRMFTGGRDRRILVWRKSAVGAWFPATELVGHENSVSTLCAVENSIWSGSRDCTIKIWKIRDQENQTDFLEKTLTEHRATVLDIVDLPKARLVLSADAAGSVCVWSREGQFVRRFQAHETWIWKICDLENGRIATCGEDGSVRIWNCMNGELVVSLELGPAALWSMARSADGLWAGTREGAVHVISVRRDDKGEVRISLKRTYRRLHTKGIRSIYPVVPSGFLTAGEDNKVLLNRIEADGTLTSTPLVEHAGFVTALEISDGVVLSSSYDGKVKQTKLQRRGENDK